MGLPIFQDPDQTETEPTVAADPTAHDRTAIRRSTTRSRRHYFFHEPPAQNSATQQSSESTSSAYTPIEAGLYPFPVPEDGIEMPGVTNGWPDFLGIVHAEPRNVQSTATPAPPSPRPRSRRGPSDRLHRELNGRGETILPDSGRRTTFRAFIAARHANGRMSAQAAVRASDYEHSLREDAEDNISAQTPGNVTIGSTRDQNDIRENASNDYQPVFHRWSGLVTGLPGDTVQHSETQQSSVQGNIFDRTAISNDFSSLFCEEPEPIPISNVREETLQPHFRVMNTIAVLRSASEHYLNWQGRLVAAGPGGLNAEEEQEMMQDVSRLRVIFLEAVTADRHTQSLVDAGEL